jgi:hypothetical protein
VAGGAVSVAAGLAVLGVITHDDSDSPTDASRQADQMLGSVQDSADEIIVDAGLFLDQASARSVEGLIKDSDLIVVGRVVGSEAVSRPEPFSVPIPCDTPLPPELAGKRCGGTFSGLIGDYLTNHTIQVETYLKGRSDAQVTVQEMGGEFDGISVRVKEWPWYEVSKRYLMFLKWDTQKPGIAYTTAAAFGGYPLLDVDVDLFPEAAAFDSGAPRELGALSESEAISRIEAAVLAQALVP